MLDELYQKVILNHNKNPSNYGVLDKHTYMAEGRNPLCGDQLTVYLNLNSDNTIEDISFEAKGCAISVASASIMSEVVKGKSIDEVDSLFEYFHRLCTGEETENPVYQSDDIEKLKVLSGVKKFPSRIKCATLSWQAVQSALKV